MQPYSPLKMVKYRYHNLHFFTKQQLHIDLHKNSKKISHQNLIVIQVKYFGKLFNNLHFINSSFSFK